MSRSDITLDHRNLVFLILFCIQNVVSCVSLHPFWNIFSKYQPIETSGKKYAEGLQKGHRTPVFVYIFVCTYSGTRQWKQHIKSYFDRRHVPTNVWYLQVPDHFPLKSKFKNDVEDVYLMSHTFLRLYSSQTSIASNLS